MDEPTATTLTATQCCLPSWCAALSPLPLPQTIANYERGSMLAFDRGQAYFDSSARRLKGGLACVDRMQNQVRGDGDGGGRGVLLPYPCLSACLCVCLCVSLLSVCLGDCLPVSGRIMSSVVRSAESNLRVGVVHRSRGFVQFRLVLVSRPLRSPVFEPSRTILRSPLRASIRASLRASLSASLRASWHASLHASLRASLRSFVLGRLRMMRVCCVFLGADGSS